MSKNEIKTLPVGCIEYMTGLTHLDMSQVDREEVWNEREKKSLVGQGVR
jgi:hypothetical protein